jgi:hypothetical protein
LQAIVRDAIPDREAPASGFERADVGIRDGSPPTPMMIPSTLASAVRFKPLTSAISFSWGEETMAFLSLARGRPVALNG